MYGGDIKQVVSKIQVHVTTCKILTCLVLQAFFVKKGAPQVSSPCACMQSAQARSVVTVIIGCPLCAVCVVPFPKQVRVTYEPPTMNVLMYVTDIAECDGKQQGTVTIKKSV